MDNVWNARIPAIYMITPEFIHSVEQFKMGLVETTQGLVGHLYEQITTTQPRPSLHPIPGTKPLTLEASILPPLLYYVALLFLPPPPPTALETIALRVFRNTIALTAGILFLRLPLAYHVPQSIGLTYQVSHLSSPL